MLPTARRAKTTNSAMNVLFLDLLPFLSKILHPVSFSLRFLTLQIVAEGCKSETMIQARSSYPAGLIACYDISFHHDYRSNLAERLFIAFGPCSRFLAVDQGYFHALAELS